MPDLLPRSTLQLLEKGTVFNASRFFLQVDSSVLPAPGADLNGSCRPGPLPDVDDGIRLAQAEGMSRRHKDQSGRRMASYFQVLLSSKPSVPGSELVLLDRNVGRDLDSHGRHQKSVVHLNVNIGHSTLVAASCQNEK